MNLYKARMGYGEFYIQPEMMELYAEAGYTIIRLEEVVVKDVKEELLMAESEMKKRSIPFKTLFGGDKNEN